MMEYVVSIAYTNKETYDVTCLKDKTFKNSEDAFNEREMIINSLPENCYSHYNKVYPRVKCHCGKMVDCMDFTNTCDCERDYNFNGDLLASRSQWGEETGEHWTECY